MKPATFEYHRPTTVTGAVEALTELPDARVLAGGQSLVPLMNLRLAAPEHLVDVNHVAELRGITDAGGRIRIGAMTRHAEVEDSALLAQHLPLLPYAVAHIGYRQIRHRGTIGGSLCHGDPVSEWPALTLALDATFHLQSRTGTRQIAAADFFLGHFETDRRDAELMTAIDIPVRPAGWGFHEETRRRGDYAVVAAVVLLHGTADGCTDARVALAGAGPRPIRLPAVEQALVGGPLTDAQLAAAATLAGQHLDPPADLHGSAEYRRRLAVVLVRRALADARSRLNTGGAA
ncbi:FAD binding domain-containing protein [Pseudonocardia sp. H11422]|uniref:FAD binding domain-containing protein n=1 Tax=Pseudonocardia sp. H11422 TaxID=2835866 RepID=UPI001BDC054F|nr:xanthine dehydrogenase family protein subunit M [Pseudonocardia sp. H11422]